MPLVKDRKAWVMSVLVLAILPPAPSAFAATRTLRVALQSEIISLDSQSVRDTLTSEFLSNIMEPLVRFNESLEVEPALAVRWERPTPTRWRFFLRRGVSFSNGNPFSAADVMFSFRRGSNPASPFHGELAGVKRIIGVDDYTVEFETAQPFPQLLRHLPALLIFDEEWTTMHGAAAPYNALTGAGNYLASHVLGTGAFLMSSFHQSGVSELEANPNWWDRQNRKHNLDRVLLQAIRSDSTRLAALLSGQVDLIFPCPLPGVARARQSPDIQVLERPSLRTLMLGINLRDRPLAASGVTAPGPNPLRDLRVRRALYQAIDVNAIVSKILLGHAQPASVLMARGIDGYDGRLDGRLLPYDPEASKRLLAQAGYPEGFSAGLECPNDRFPNDEALCTSLAAMFARVGVKISLNTRTKARYLQEILSGRADLFLLGWAASESLNAESFLRQIMHSPSPLMGYFNPGSYSNPRVDELTGLTLREADPQKRRDFIFEAFRIHKEEIGHIPLVTLNLVCAARRNVDFTPAPVDGLWLRYIRIR